MVSHVAALALLGSMLGVAALLKLMDPTATAVAAETYGLSGRLAVILTGPLAVLELGLAAGALAAWGPALWASAGLLAGFGIAQAAALAAGRGGAACGCFGARGRLSRAGVARTVGLSGLAVVLALTTTPPPADGRAAGAVAALAVVLAIVLRTRRARDRRPALELADEGPSLGAALALDLPPGDLRLALFTSDGCSLCRRLRRPASRVGAVSFDEHRAAPAWAAAAVPGAPYVVVLGADDRVLAKGAVNSASQIRSVVAAARERLGTDQGRERPAAAGPTSRRGFLVRAGAAVAAVAAGRTVGSLVRPDEADAFHFCGHIYTTDGCPHPTGLPRIDARGFPLRARDGKPVDDLGRVVDAHGTPVGDDGRRLRDPDGRPLPAATRTRVCTATGRRFGITSRIDGAWYRCCGGHVRKLIDCCSTSERRINGDGALKGYCYENRKVFCVMYHQTRVPC